MSIASENIAIKQPIKRLEIQINNFNVAIPHHVDLLKQYKINIRKYQQKEEWVQVRKEHINITRVIKQLKELLYQMDTLRSQVLDNDINEFDKLTASARNSILQATNDYLNMKIELPSSTAHKQDSQDDSLFKDHAQILQEEEILQNQQACLSAWNNLQIDIQELQQLFIDFNEIVNSQKELVNRAEEHIKETEINVTEGEGLLQKALRYKAATYPVAGALLGTILGGPVGFVAGIKLGGLAALGGGVLGFTGGTILKKRKISSINKNV
ncbi:syntaxin-17 [Prorops nasuta]|uniref:syntaxin-17 n=1 Tax=Prorops nasuta TaxID=863751 RepID=UPI0034CE7DEC